MLKGILSLECGNVKYTNPAAVIESIKVSDLKGNEFYSPLPGLIDTGCDRSAVPLDICTSLRLPLYRKILLAGFDSKVDLYPTYLVYLKVEDMNDVPFEVCGVKRKNVLLGRDFLKNMLLVVSSKTSAYAISENSRWKTLCLKLIRAL